MKRFKMCDPVGEGSHTPHHCSFAHDESSAEIAAQADVIGSSNQFRNSSQTPPYVRLCGEESCGTRPRWRAILCNDLLVLSVTPARDCHPFRRILRVWDSRHGVGSPTDSPKVATGRSSGSRQLRFHVELPANQFVSRCCPLLRRPRIRSYPTATI
jgi:hypothetical protein